MINDDMQPSETFYVVLKGTARAFKNRPIEEVDQQYKEEEKKIEK